MATRFTVEDRIELVRQRVYYDGEFWVLNFPPHGAQGSRIVAGRFADVKGRTSYELVGPGFDAKRQEGLLRSKEGASFVFPGVRVTIFNLGPEWTIEGGGMPLTRGEQLMLEG